ncbi:MAG: lytic transglycosylase domain-containing protein [Sphingopyxis sp.]|nr:lytic transglycosylase domain-containing protein [Sphingopyxis sp.]
MLPCLFAAALAAFAAPAAAMPIGAGAQPVDIGLGPAASPVAWGPFVEEASRRFGVPARWIKRVMMAESGGRTMFRGRPTTSSAGAMGLMQLMPGTWADMRRRLGLGSDPHDPRDNIMAGTLYLRLMHDRFGYPGLFGAYNAGPARYAAYLGGRQQLPAETRAYMMKVTDSGANPSIVPAAKLRRSVSAAPRADDIGVRSGGLPRPEEAARKSEIFFIRR